MPTLRLLNLECGSETAFLLDENPVSIGREHANTLALEDSSVSSFHCEVSYHSGDFFIADQGSDGGTYVNGAQVTRSRLSCGDRIKIGQSCFVFDDSSGCHQKIPALDSWVELDQEQRTVMVGKTAILAAHRINNILQAINGGSHLVEMGLKRNDLENVAKGWNTVRKNQSELALLLSDLVALGKPWEARFESVDLAGLIRDSVQGLAAIIKDYEAEQYFHGDWAEISIHADPRAMAKVVENLIRVALEASRHSDERQLDFRLEQTPKHTEFSIEYWGKEINLDPARTLDPMSGTATIQGGVQFAMSRKLAIEHGGDVRLSELSDSSHHRISLLLPRWTV